MRSGALFCVISGVLGLKTCGECGARTGEVRRFGKMGGRHSDSEGTKKDDSFRNGKSRL